MAYRNSGQGVNMDKQEALAKLADIDRKADELKLEAEALRKIVDAPEGDYSAWLGKWGFYSDDNPACPNDGFLRRLQSYEAGEDLPFTLTGGHWRYFRPATPEELGFPGIAPDWSKAPKWARWWAQDANGSAWWYATEPQPVADTWGECTLTNTFRDNDSCPNWRKTLHKRPE